MRKLRQANPAMIFSLFVLTIFTLFAVLGGLIVPHDPEALQRDPETGQLLRMSPPSSRHWFGTTNQGRDVFSQVIVGTKVSLITGLSAALSSVIIGLIIGILVGYYQGWLDKIVMRMVDIGYSLPFEPLAIVLLAMTYRSVWMIVVVIALLAWLDVARVVRAQVLSIVRRPYVKAAMLSGASHSRIMFKHIAPNIIPLLFVYLPINFGRAVLGEASISFLGFGDPNVITWGQMLQLAFLNGAAREAWWWVIPPGLCISLVVLAVFFISRTYEAQFNLRRRVGI